MTIKAQLSAKEEADDKQNSGSKLLALAAAIKRGAERSSDGGSVGGHGSKQHLQSVGSIPEEDD